MAESGKIREIDSADSSDESTEFSDANNILSVRNELQVSRPSMLRTVQEFGKNIFQSLVKHSEEHGTVVAPTFVFNQNIKEGDNIETSIAGSSGFTLDRSSNTYEKTSTTKQKAAKSNDAVENETKGEIPFHFEDSIRVDHNLYLLYNEKLAKYGEVYRGLQTHKGSRGFDTIAIKSIKLSDKNRKEVEIIRKLRSHPNVITVLQSGTYFFGPIEHLFIAMEYYKSKTLTDFVNDDPKPKTDEVKHKQIEQVIEAVDHIHVNAVLHRDLKPDNILVSDNGRTLKIIDFGLGKQLRKGHSGTKMSTLRIGTDGWRAPEIYFSGICSKQSDIFSSALVIHFIYTDGSHPFGEDPDSWNLNIKLYQGCDLSKLERDLEDLVGWMIRYQPQQRPNTEQIRKHKYFRGQLVCPHPKLSLIVPKTPKKEIVEVRRESVKMKQMQLENEQEKRKMMKEMEKLKKKMKEQDSVKFRQESERMRREHAIEKMQEEKRKMEIEIEKLKTEKKGSVVRSALEKEVVRVKQEFEERMKQMELKNELEKLKMMEEMEKLIKKTKKEEIVKVRQESERMRREHEEEMKRMQEEKRKMEIEIKKLKTGKKDFAQLSNISETNQLAVSTGTFKSISHKISKVECQEFQSLSQTTSGLRITNQQPSDGTMTWMWLFESLPGYEGKGTLALVLATCVITYSFSAGCLGGISYEAQEFTEYLPWNNHGRICYNLLHHAFNAGLIFKIQKVGYRRGKIVWNDEFPHKTNKTGGPENNGYPDPNHLTKLRETLEAKGFKF